MVKKRWLHRIDGHSDYRPYMADCTTCKWFDNSNFVCDAYPDGIPDRILSGEVMHREVQPDQKDIILYVRDNDRFPE